MQAPTTNPITQTKHGSFNAVDYAAAPDVYYYAPENGTINSIVRNNGNCGYSFNLSGVTGNHGFCHNEEVYVTDGQRVVRGQKLAKMGYTGLTVPAGEAGRHLHWILNIGGTWVYPPNYINEAFKKEDNVSKEAVNQDELDKICWLATGMQAKSNENFQNNLGNPLSTVLDNFMNYTETKNLHLDAEAYRSGQTGSVKVEINGVPYEPSK